jgi:hypothetical protein
VEGAGVSNGVVLAARACLPLAPAAIHQIILPLSLFEKIINMFCQKVHYWAAV